jgi:urease accessory protein
VSYGAGTLAITARRSGTQTILERLRFDGISRCSRAFRDGDAARVMLSQLGPGVVRGDAVTTSGHVRAGAHLIVTSQAATRLMGGPRPSRAQATWSLDERAVLELIGEPLVAGSEASYDATTIVELQPGSFIVMSELTRVSAAADVRLRTSVRRTGRELYYDAVDAAACAPQAVGTFAIVGLEAARVAALLAAIDAATDHDSRVGVGGLPTGVFARILADDLWAIRSLLSDLRAAAWSALRDDPA